MHAYILAMFLYVVTHKASPHTLGTLFPHYVTLPHDLMYLTFCVTPLTDAGWAYGSVLTLFYVAG